MKMYSTKKLNLILITCLAFISTPVMAAEEFETDKRQIQKIRFYSAERPLHLGYQDIAIVSVNSGTIAYGSATGCNSEEFAVLNTDKSLISSLISARVAGIEVILAVEKTSTHGNGNFCRIVKVEM
ncbi:hypothetical protein ACFL2V_20035 [Pseudomonadota bacterium]